MTPENVPKLLVWAPLVALAALLIWNEWRAWQLARRERCEHDFRVMSPDWIARHPHPFAGDFYRSKCRKCGRLSVHIYVPLELKDEGEP